MRDFQYNYWYALHYTGAQTRLVNDSFTRLVCAPVCTRTLLYCYILI